MKMTALGKIIVAGIVLCIVFLMGCIIFNYIYIKNHAVSFFDGSDWVSIIIGDITAISTLGLGYVSCWQNQQQREDNRQEQRRMQARYEQEREEIIKEHRLDVLRQNLNNYRKQLYELDLMILEKNPSAGLLEYNEVLAELYKAQIITEGLRQKLIEFDHWIAHNIKYLNFIYNSIVYTLYYVDKLDDCALSIVRLRHHYERMSTKYFWKWIKQPELVTDGIEALEEFQTGIAELMRLSIDFESYFSIYKQAALGFFQRIEYKNDVRAFFDWFDKSDEKVGLLRKEVLKMEKEFAKEKENL